MSVETLLYTSLDRADLFTWQAQIMHERGPALRVDTWTLYDHPAPGGTFTLYACTLVYAAPEQQESE